MRYSKLPRNLMNAAQPLYEMMHPRFDRCFTMISQHASICRADPEFGVPGSLQPPRLFIPNIISKTTSHVSRLMDFPTASSAFGCPLLILAAYAPTGRPASGCWSRSWRALDEGAPDSVQ